MNKTNLIKSVIAVAVFELILVTAIIMSTLWVVHTTHTRTKVYQSWTTKECVDVVVYEDGEFFHRPCSSLTDETYERIWVK